MYRLLEITYTNNKESVALYPTDEQEPFKDETALTAEFDTKMGAAMKTDAYKVEYLVAFDQTGKIYAEGYTSKDDTVSLSPRIIWVNATAEGETANQNKVTDLNTLKADFYTKRGSAKKNASVLATLNMGFNGKSITINNYWVRPIAPVEE